MQGLIESNIKKLKIWEKLRKLEIWDFMSCLMFGLTWSKKRDKNAFSRMRIDRGSGYLEWGGGYVCLGEGEGEATAPVSVHSIAVWRSNIIYSPVPSLWLIQTELERDRD